MPKAQKIGVSAFISRDDKVLLLKRSESEKAFPDFWELPGGKVEFGETPEDALKRELLEEAGIEIKVSNPYTCFSYIFNEKHYIDIQFLCETRDKTIKLSEEHSKYTWILKNKISKLKMSKEMKEAILKGFDSINS